MFYSCYFNCAVRLQQPVTQFHARWRHDSVHETIVCKFAAHGKLR